MINRLLVANRGEIARRIMKTCRELGVETVAVFSDADADSAFVSDADMAVSIGGQTPAESYLRIDAIIEAAKRTNADAIHPGYGFLAENADFAQAVAAAGLIFVGPTAEVIGVMGSKLESKRRMADAGVPLLPSAELTGLGAAAAAAAVEGVGYPALLKASAGGGGRGMRIVNQPSELAEAVDGATREAESAFGDGTVYAERYVSPSRHVEVQIFGDQSGRVVHFHERECSIQRRHQKIIEEAPSPSLTPEVRDALHSAAVKAGTAIGYTNAGTVEFLLADTGEFFFLEVNTRLQVEHPVTEAILGVDLVQLQLEVASGGSVPEQSTIGPVRGHAIEARLYAEDPQENFRPSTGSVHVFSVPPDVRLDTAIDASGIVTQFYDPMIAKVIAHGPNRTTAARKLAGALAKTTLTGIESNRDLLVRTLRHEEFLGDAGDSEFLLRNDPATLGRPLVEGAAASEAAVAAMAVVQHTNRSIDIQTRAVSSGFRNVRTQPQAITFTAGSEAFDVRYAFVRGVLQTVEVNSEALVEPEILEVVEVDSPGEKHRRPREFHVDLSFEGLRRNYQVFLTDEAISVSSNQGSIAFVREPRFPEQVSEAEPGSMVASMPGTIVAVAVAVGDSVSAGDPLVVMEAMKMELTMSASTDGTIATVPVSVGETVEAGQVLVVVAASD